MQQLPPGFFDTAPSAVVAVLAKRGTPASYCAVSRVFAREGITFKKRLYASEQDRVDIARRRGRWKMHQGRLDPRAWCSSTKLGPRPT